MKILRPIYLVLSFLALALFCIVYIGTNRMNDGYYITGSGIWALGDLVRVTAILTIALALVGVMKRDKRAWLALLISASAVALLYITGWHAFVHDGV